MRTALMMLFSNVAGILSTISGGLTMMKYWSWFIVARFAGAPLLTWGDSIAVMLVFGLFMINAVVAVTNIDDDTTAADGFFNAGVKNMVLAWVVYPVMLVAGYIWHQFI